MLGKVDAEGVKSLMYTPVSILIIVKLARLLFISLAAKEINISNLARFFIYYTQITAIMIEFYLKCAQIYFWKTKYLVTVEKTVKKNNSSKNSPNCFRFRIFIFYIISGISCKRIFNAFTIISILRPRTLFGRTDLKL